MIEVRFPTSTARTIRTTASVTMQEIRRASASHVYRPHLTSVFEIDCLVHTHGFHMNIIECILHIPFEIPVSEPLNKRILFIDAIYPKVSIFVRRSIDPGSIPLAVGFRCSLLLVLEFEIPGRFDPEKDPFEISISRDM